MRTAPLLAPIVAGLAALTAAVASSVACDDAYEAPCRIVREQVLVSDVAIAAGGSIAKGGGRAIASWFVLGDSGDDAGADGGLVGLPTVAGFEVAVVDEGGALVRRATVPAPDGLRARFGGLPEAGLLVEDGAFLVHWIETTARTDENGLVRTDAALKLARVRDGAVTPLSAFDVACARCTMKLAGAAVGAQSLVFVRLDPDARGLPRPSRPPPPTFVVLRVAQDGTVTREEAPWLGVPVRSLSAGLTTTSTDLDVAVDDGGALAVVSARLAWRVDASSLRVLAGPVVLPDASDVRVAWNDAGEGTLLWSVSPYDEGRATSPSVPRDLFSGRVPAGAFGIATRERATEARQAVALARRRDEIGALFESGGRLLFAELDPDGTKHGGDLVLGARRTMPTSGDGVVTGPGVLLSPGGRRFTAVSLGSGELAVTEVACAR